MSTSRQTVRQYGRKSSAIPPIPESSLGDVTPALSPMFKPPPPDFSTQAHSNSHCAPFVPLCHPALPPLLKTRYASQVHSPVPIPHPETAANLRQNTASIPHHATAIIPPCCPPLNTLRASSPLPRHQYHPPKAPPTCGRTPLHHPPGTPRFHPTSRNHNYCNEHKKQKLPVTNTHDFLRRNAFFENFPLTFYNPV